MFRIDIQKLEIDFFSHYILNMCFSEIVKIAKTMIHNH